MCGIAGVVGDVRSEDRRSVRGMCAAMAHRGPDDEGYVDVDGASIGMRRLSILDIDHGRQPVFDESGRISAVFNGEIYNYRDLQDLLRRDGHTLKSESDSECLPHLYEKLGARFVEHLRGMFAIAVWDDSKMSLLLARDRVGKKPLFYSQIGQRLWFASELKCLLTVGEIPKELDLASLNGYLTYQYVPNPSSILAGVKKLPPATVLSWSSGKASLSEYWKLSYPAADAKATAPASELAEVLRDQLVDATRLRMNSERPLGAFLSGGLDSSAVVAAMARSSATPVSTFSIGFEDERFNELPYARQVAAQYGTNHHELVVKPNIEDTLPRIAEMFDEPFADSSAVPSYYVAEMASREVVVVLNGDGGDESLGGYSRYPRFLMAAPQISIPPALAALAGRAADRLDRSTIRSVLLRRVAHVSTRAAGATPPLRYARMMSYFTPEQRRRLFRPEVLNQLGDNDPYSQLVAAWDVVEGTDTVNKMLASDVAMYLPGDLLPKVDITTMAVSIEARSPLLDQVFMEWAASLPGAMKVRDGNTKHLFKFAMEPWLPQHLIYRKKMGFGIPREDWLRGPLRPMVHDLLLGGSVNSARYLRKEEIRYWVERNDRFGDAGPRVWALLMLELWFRRVLHVER